MNRIHIMKTTKPISKFALPIILLITLSGVAHAQSETTGEFNLSTDETPVDVSGFNATEKNNLKSDKINVTFSPNETCRQFLERNAASRTIKANDHIKISKKIALGGLLSALLITPQFGIPVMAGGIIYSTYSSIRVAGAYNVLNTIDEAYLYKMTGQTGYYLEKLQRKMNRRINIGISISDIADAVLKADREGKICSNSRGLEHFADELANSL